MHACVYFLHVAEEGWCGVMQAKITMIRLYQRFTFELEAGQDTLELRETITISAANGVLVKAVPRPPPNNLF